MLEQLRKRALAAVTAASIVPVALGCAAEEAAAPSESDVVSGQSCTDTLNRVDDIRNRLLDSRHSTVWAFMNDSSDALTTLESAPTVLKDDGKKKIAGLSEVTYQRWKPSAAVRAGLDLASDYIVVRGLSASGETRIVYIFDWTTGAEIATGQARAGKNAVLSWTCPPAKPSANASYGRTAVKCGPNVNWSNWPNWQNWTNWCNM
jgi:hypothetical protein